MDFKALIEFGEKRPEGVIYQSSCHWNAKSVSDALSDILKRSILEDVNSSDTLLLNIHT